VVALVIVNKYNIYVQYIVIIENPRKLREKRRGGPVRVVDHVGFFFSTTRHRAKRTARPGRIGHGSATDQMVNLCGDLFGASLPRPKHGVVAPNLGDDSGRHEDHGTTENTEITERKTRRNPKEGTMMEEDQIN